jgi:hypothetical protein
LALFDFVDEDGDHENYLSFKGMFITYFSLYSCYVQCEVFAILTFENRLVLFKEDDVITLLQKQDEDCFTNIGLYTLPSSFLKEGDIITLLQKPDEDWWEGEIGGRKGLFPCNFVEENQ